MYGEKTWQQQHNNGANIPTKKYLNGHLPLITKTIHVSRKVGTNLKNTYSCGPHHMKEQRQDAQLEPKYNSSVPIQDVAYKTY